MTNGVHYLYDCRLHKRYSEIRLHILFKVQIILLFDGFRGDLFHFILVEKIRPKKQPTAKMDLKLYELL